MYRFSLAICFMDVQPSLAFPLLHDFWVEWLPSTHAVLQVHEFVASQGVKKQEKQYLNLLGKTRSMQL